MEACEGQLRRIHLHQKDVGLLVDTEVAARAAQRYQGHVSFVEDSTALEPKGAGLNLLSWSPGCSV